MTENQQKQFGYYVYCIAESSATQQLDAASLPAPIEEKSKLEWVTVNDLAALASTVPLDT